MTHGKWIRGQQWPHWLVLPSSALFSISSREFCCRTRYITYESESESAAFTPTLLSKPGHSFFGAGFLVVDRENVGKFWARNQHIAHNHPTICQYSTHNSPTSTICQHFHQIFPHKLSINQLFVCNHPT